MCSRGHAPGWELYPAIVPRPTSPFCPEPASRVAESEGTAEITLPDLLLLFVKEVPQDSGIK